MIEKGAILVVDDTAGSLKLLKSILEAEGYRVDLADSGERALASVGARRPDLILLDIRMPGMDGFEVCRRMKAQVESRDIPIIFISSVTAVTEWVEGFRLGAVDFISKPFRREELLARVRTHLALSRLHIQLKQTETELLRANQDLQTEIAERQRSEEVLAASEMRYRRLFESAKDGILILDAVSGRIVDVNPYMENMLGYSHSEFLGKELWEIGVFKDIAASQESFAELQEKEYIRYKDLPLATKAGTSIAVEFVSNVYAVDHTKVIQCNIRNITDRKQIEAALKDSEQRYRLLAENAADVIWTMDMNLRLTYISPSVKQQQGLRPEELLGKTLEDIMTPASAEAARKLYAETLDRGWELKPAQIEPKRFDAELLKPDGAIFLAEITVSFLRDDSGRPVGFVGITRDITERKQAEKAQQEHTHFLQTLIDAIPAPVFFKDTESRYLGCNRAFEDFYNTTKQNIIGKTVFDIAPREQAEIYFAKDAELLQQGGTQVYEASAIQSDGYRREVVFNKATFQNADGSLGGIIGAILDITERKWAEEALQESERQFREVLENVKLVAVTLDLRGKIVFCNDFLLQLTGWRRQEIAGRDWFEHFIPEEMRESLRTNFNQLIPSGAFPTNYENDLVTRAGESRAVSWSNIPLRDRHGKIIGITSIGEDITERKLAEEALAASREQLRAVLENVGIGISLLSPDMRVLQLNRKMREWYPEFPVDACPLCYQAYNDPPREAPCSYCPCVRTWQDGQVYEAVTDTPSAGGTRHYRIVASPIRDAAGKIVSVIEMVDDITERKETELALLKGNRALRVLSECNEALVRAADETDLLNTICANLVASGGYRLAWVGFKEAGPAKTVLPIAFAGVEGDYLRRIRVSWGNNPNGQCPTGRAIRTGKPQVCKDIARDPGFTLWREAALELGFASFLALPLIAAGETFGALNIYSAKPDAFDREEILLLEELANDLAYGIKALRAHAEHQRAEEEIRKLNLELEQRVQERTAQLEALNLDLESFSYSVSHDLRAPLRSIDGFSLALLEEYQDKLGSQAKKDLQRVRAAAQRMGQLIENLLSLSRVSRTPLHWEKVNLTKLAKEIADELQQTRRDRKAAFDIAKGLTAQGDPALLRSVLENLLSNAWKFTGKQAAAKIAFGAKEAKGETVYFVRDNGAGFDPAYAHKLFGVFQRLHSTAEFPGTGIGLATVQRIIRRHNGRIWAEGELEKGATFYFTLGNEPG